MEAGLSSESTSHTAHNPSSLRSWYCILRVRLPFGMEAELQFWQYRWTSIHSKSARSTIQSAFNLQVVHWATEVVVLHTGRATVTIGDCSSNIALGRMFYNRWYISNFRSYIGTIKIDFFLQKLSVPPRWYSLFFEIDIVQLIASYLIWLNTQIPYYLILIYKYVKPTFTSIPSPDYRPQVKWATLPTAFFAFWS